MPFLRPKEIADDYTSNITVIKHFANNFDLIENEDTICCLYATTPFIRSSDLKMIDIFNKEMRKKNDLFAAKIYSIQFRGLFS